VAIRQCDKLHELNDKQIADIFKKYAIDKIVRFEESNEVIVEFRE
jgi:hypothetical protein